MKPSRLIVPALLGLAVFLLALRVYRTYMRPVPPAVPAPTAVAVESARLETPVDRVRYLGTVRGDGDAVLAFHASGAVAEVLVREGDRVAERQLLARIDLPEMGPRLEQARHQGRRAELDHAHLRDVFETNERLYQEGALSRAQRDESRLRHDTAAAAMASARAALAEAEARHALQWLRAPAEGVIAAVHLRPGEFAAAGHPAVTLSAGQRTVEVDALEADVADGLREGARAWGGPLDAPWEGAITRLEPLSRPPFRTVRVHIAFPAEVLAAYPSGAAVPVRIERGVHPEAITVPRSAIDRRGDTPRVFRVRDDLTVESVPVELGARWDERQAVRGDIAPGDRIAASGVSRLAPGARVHPVSEGSTP